jgi:sucrose-6-phosphate hydrolase SacC (GH32 family)
MNFTSFPSPILLQGDATTAYRDPAVYFHNNCFYLYFTLVETEHDGRVFLYLAMTTSTDLKNFSTIRKLSPRDQSLNFSSPGNIIDYCGEFRLCCQTYCRENGEKYGNENSRIWQLRSTDLTHWSNPELLKVKGDIPQCQMGRMIDPYLLRDKDNPEIVYCFYKQNGVSISRSTDLENWEYIGNSECGENVCVLVESGEYWLWHSPRNGIGLMTSRDLINWKHSDELITLGQKDWDWARGRLTAGFVLDLRKHKEIGKALLFYHGTGPENEEVIFDQYASIGFAWSDDLQTWDYPKNR